MEPTISLGGNLPKDEEYNGLWAIFDELVGADDQRAEERVCVVKLNVNYVKDKTRGDNSPVLQILRIEPMTDAQAKDAANSLLIAAYELRTQRGRMPFATAEGESADVDASTWETGEIRPVVIADVSALMTVLRGRFYIAPPESPAPADSRPGTWIEFDRLVKLRLTGDPKERDEELRAVFMSGQEPSAMDRLGP